MSCADELSHMSTIKSEAVSDAEVSDSFSSNSEQASLSDTSDTEPTCKKMKRNPPSNRTHEIIDFVINDFETSDEEPFEDDAPIDSIKWGPITCNNRKHFPFTIKPAVSDEFDTYVYKSPYEFFKYFVNEDVMNLMVAETNRYAKQVIEGNDFSAKSRVHKWADVTYVEMERFLGLIFWMSLNRKPKLSDYWSNDVLYDNKIKKLMSRNRFELILRMWHFASGEDTPSADDRLYKIQPLLDLLLKKFQSAVAPDRHLSVDSLVTFLGKLSFKQFSENKRHTYGVKVLRLSVNSGYTYNLLVKCGRDGRQEPVSSPLVLKLMEGVLDSGRVLYTDSTYTSVHLAEELLKRSTYLVGMLKANKKDNPPLVTKCNVGKLGQIWQTSNTGVTVLKWKDNKDMLVLSTYHDDSVREVYRRGGIVQLPKVIYDYNRIKAVTETSEQIKSYSGFLRRGVKWFRQLAVELLTGCTLTNAYLLYEKVTGNKLPVTKFRELVATELLHMADGPLETKLTANKDCFLINKGSARRRCITCYEKLKKGAGREYASKRCKQTPWKCASCNAYYCIECFFAVHAATKV